jgi:putative SOS response-associated peptidase YedK
MCGRVVVASPSDVLAEFFEVDERDGEELDASYNVAPTASVYAVAGTASGRRMAVAGWGLVPSWAPDPTAGPRPINARAESLLERPHFADAVARRRCLVPVDGFYEWSTRGGRRQPHFITRRDGSPMALAGLWDVWRSAGGERLLTCAVITTAANEAIAGLHDRMPAILERQEWDAWLDPALDDGARATELLRPAPDDAVALRPVRPLVNSTANDGPELLEPAEIVEELQLPL